MHHEFRISISDCPNACSRPQIVDVGLVGACVPETTDEPCTACEACLEVCKEKAISLQAGRPVIDNDVCLYCGQCVKACPTGTLAKGVKGYRILVGGKLGRHPRLARELAGIHDSEETQDVVERCLAYYQKHCMKGERFGEILASMSTEELERNLGK